MRRLLPLLAISLLASMVAATATLAGAGTASPVTISLIPTELAFAPGADATVIIRIQADNPESVNIQLSVENGVLSGVVAPNLVSPGVAEGMAFVRRETAGAATVRASLNGIEVASTVVTFANPVVGGDADFDPPLPTVLPDAPPVAEIPFAPESPLQDHPGTVAKALGVVAIEAHLKAGREAAARTWRFEVVDASGHVAVVSAFSLSGDAPSVLKLSEIEPGLYTVRPVLGKDSGHSCDEGKLFEISAPARVVIPGRAEARFTVTPCPANTLPAPQPTTAETPAAEPSRTIAPLAPLPPATGSGISDEGSGIPDYVRKTVGLTLLITIAVACLLWRLAARSRR